MISLICGPMNKFSMKKPLRFKNVLILFRYSSRFFNQSFFSKSWPFSFSIPYLLRLHYLYGFKSSFKAVAVQASNFPVDTYINPNSTLRPTLYANHPNILRVSDPQLISLSSLVDNYQDFFGFKPDIIAFHYKDIFKIPELFSPSCSSYSPYPP